jgi:hypothetical protein
MLQLPRIIVLASLMLLTVSQAAHAFTINWTLQDVLFKDGATASGTFSTDSITGSVVDFDIVTSPGSLGGFTYKPPSSTLFSNSNGFLVDGDPDFIMLIFANPLDSPGVDQLVPGDVLCGVGSCESDGSEVRVVSGGEAIAEGVTPVPPGLPLLAAGLIMIGLFVWRGGRRRPRGLCES